MVRTGRCFLSLDKENDALASLVFDEGAAYNFLLQMQKAERKSWALSGVFRRGEEKLALESPTLLTDIGFLFHGGSVARVADNASWEWITHLRKIKTLEVPEADCHQFLTALLPQAELPELELPAELQYELAEVKPRPCLKLSQGQGTKSDQLHADLSYRYEDQLFTGKNEARGFYLASEKRFVPRDLLQEASAGELLQKLGLKPAQSREVHQWELASAKLPGVLHALVKREWEVEVDGKFFHRAGDVHLGVTSGIDWFELRGGVQYEGFTVQLPQLLEALRSGTNMVQLEDGSYGLLPEEWLDKIRTVAEMGLSQDGHVRFRKNQAGLLDALLAAQPQINCDETFARVREQLQRFEGVAPSDQPEGFAGQLREYQREGLGWMHFLRGFSFGGCLADDMGVGKTAQVLALLETRRELRERGEVAESSLVVVPKSLVFNWKQEAARFAPKLRLLDYTGAARDNSEIVAHDVVLTTYGTLRRDIEHLSSISFDYVILDEAQAIKNASTGSAKATLLLRGSHRLAMSGTPVENHLGELWSLFEFLNPGMLGAAKVFNMTDGAMRNPNEDTRKMLAYALRPFILRRTKEQVATELPEKIQQTIFCEMSASQRELYDELRQHYRDALLGRVKNDGLAKSKIQILEALLRLRQAACHPGLLDQKRLSEPSAKLDVLLDQLEEVLDEGHKALVFSQFTSLLSIVSSSLKSKGLAYEYLDGKTQDRQAKVEHFQNDPDCKVFLISLKAGGVGLNLTAADYVFILDPWWNPAAEAQAIDRAHRIGQTRKVCAYRLIAKDSIEEKVLELQEAKRDLATAIIGEENSLIRDLKAEDLELLLS
jgi:superfamily II DNA or RNA helicase